MILRSFCIDHAFMADKRTSIAQYCLTKKPQMLTLVRGFVIFDRMKLDERGIDEAFARMLEIDRDAGADHGLHLPDAPIGLAGVSHAHAGNEAANHRILLLRLPDRRAPTIDSVVGAVTRSRGEMVRAR